MRTVCSQTPLGLRIEFKDHSLTSEIEYKTEQIYLKAWAIARDLGSGEILRIWNFIPNINYFDQNLENYQRFCAGRKKAFQSLELKDSQYPAASAVGSQNDEIHFHFLFGHKSPLKISNPAQVEAYNYPQNYGPTPPSFARASVLEKTLFLSGTASIRGHETLYAKDLKQQLNCTLENIDIVLNEAQHRTSETFQKKSMHWRVYLRDLNFKEEVHHSIQESLGAKLEYIKADICRSDLMIEIEGIHYGL